MDHIETSIRERAYALWERDGRLDGRDAHYWTLAEQELRGASAAPVAVPESAAARVPAEQVAAVEAPAAEAPVTEAAKPVRKPAARKPAARKVAAETPAAKAVVKAVADVAEAVAKPAPRRRRPAAEVVTTH